MYLLDTNVVSELRKMKPHGGLLAWLKELPEDSVHISAVTLGELQAGVERTRRQIPAHLQEQLAGMHPLGRLGTPQDVARAAVYLASAESSWITGVILDVAGGAVLV